MSKNIFSLNLQNTCSFMRVFTVWKNTVGVYNMGDLVAIFQSTLTIQSHYL